MSYGHSIKLKKRISKEPSFAYKGLVVCVLASLSCGIIIIIETDWQFVSREPQMTLWRTRTTAMMIYNGLVACRCTSDQAPGFLLARAAGMGVKLIRTV